MEMDEVLQNGEEHFRKTLSFGNFWNEDIGKLETSQIGR